MASMIDIRKRILASSELAPLPPEYQKVKYIVGFGSACNFDTGIRSDNDNLRIVISVEFDKHSGYFGFLGSYQNEATNSWRLLMRGGTSDTGLMANMNTRTGSAKTVTTADGSSIIGKRIYFDVSQPVRKLTIGSKSNINAEIPEKGSDNSKNIAVGNANTGAGHTNSGVHTKWYFCRFYDSGTLIRDYIPCYRKSDNVVGMYDSVNHTFNPSTGAQQFTLS